MSKKFTLFIYNNASNALYNAYQFATQAKIDGQEIAYIFFWRESVSVANQQVILAGDDLNLQALWQDFSRTWDMPLTLCKASAWRRGITNDNLAAGFVLGSVGTLSEHLTVNHQLISF